MYQPWSPPGDWYIYENAVKDGFARTPRLVKETGNGKDLTALVGTDALLWHFLVAQYQPERLGGYDPKNESDMGLPVNRDTVHLREYLNLIIKLNAERVLSPQFKEQVIQRLFGTEPVEAQRNESQDPAARRDKKARRK